MRFDILTIFPSFFDSPLSESLLARAREKGLLEFAVHDLRDFADDRHRKVDDEPYGGGPGMVMMAPVVVAGIEAVRSKPVEPPAWTVLLSPGGRRLDQKEVRDLAGKQRLLLVCGRYEGVDERVRSSEVVDAEISIGDYVLFGGETAALVVIEAVSRLVPGVVKEAESVAADSFFDGRLDYPHYTRPREFRGQLVPEVLLSGDHEAIRRWRLARALEETLRRRPDLLDGRPLSEQEKALLEQIRRR
jgi:tRNA (guanine37-N1)-methyltransferase